MLQLDEDALVACVSCGLCLPHCPTYRVTGLEVASPRGRIAAMRAVQRGDAAWDDDFADAMEACVQCRGCEAACPSSVQFGALMEGAREALHESPPRRRRWTRRAFEALAFRGVLSHHRVLLVVTWILLAAQRLHLVPRRLGLPLLRARSLRRLRFEPTPRADVALFTGCVMDAWQRDTHRAAMGVMRATGARVAGPGRGGDCCGALHEHAGRTDEARRLAARVIRAFPGEHLVVVDSAGCGAAMKDYGRWLGSDEARAFSARVRDFSQWLVEVGVPPLAPTGRRVVIQDPCHLRHVQRCDGAVREALARAYVVLETADEGLCCGAGGTYSLGHPELARAIRDRKVAAIRAAAGDAPAVVASANPGCAMHLEAAGLEVAHPADLVQAALVTNEGGGA